MSLLGVAAAAVFTIGQHRDAPSSGRPAIAHTGVPAPSSVEQARRAALDDYIARAEQAMSREQWSDALVLLGRAAALADGHDERMAEVTRLEEQAQADCDAQVVFERFRTAVASDDIDAFVRHYRQIPEHSAYHPQATPAYVRLRRDWLEETRSRAQKLSRRARCEELATLLARAQALFPGHSAELQALHGECEARATRRAQASHRAELMETAHAAYHQGKYRDADRACHAAWSIHAGSPEDATLCGLAACKRGRAHAAGHYHARLPASAREELAQVCLEQGIDVRSP